MNSKDISRPSQLRVTKDRRIFLGDVEIRGCHSLSVEIIGGTLALATFSVFVSSVNMEEIDEYTCAMRE